MTHRARWLPRLVQLSLVIALAAIVGPRSAHGAFIRGDVNESGSLELADAVMLLEALYSGGPQPNCLDAADVNDDGSVSIIDPVWIVTYLFAGGPEPSAPFPTSGGDPTPDSIYCSAPGVVVTVVENLASVGSQITVTVVNDNPSAVTISVVQASAAGGGSTDASFGGSASVVADGAATTELTLNMGSRASATSGDRIAITAEGEVAAEITAFEVSLSSISFNHTADNLSDAVELRQTRTVDILVPEYLSGVRNQPALYVAGTSPTLSATFDITPSDLGETIDVSASSSGSFSDLAPTPIPATGGTVLVPVSQPVPSEVGRNTVEWTWQGIRSGSGSDPFEITVTEHTVFVVLGVPSAPWNPTASGGTRQPRVDALEVLADFAGGATTFEAAREGVVRSGYDLPSFRYDTVSGSPGFGNFTGSSYNFNLDSYIAQGFGGTGSVVGCCYDSAGIIVCFNNLNGDDMNWLASGNGFVGGLFGYLNVLDPIGVPTPYSNNPFTQNFSFRDDPICAQNGNSSNTQRSQFGNHTFGGIGSGATALIYDLTCTFDLDSNPDTTAVWPFGTTASTALIDTELTDAGELWSADEFADFILRADVQSTFPNPYPEYTIVGNTQDTITVSGGSLTTWAQAGNLYEIFDPSEPQVSIEYALGWDWPTYRQICVDDQPSTNTPNPIIYGFTFP